jgi:hypothetical protein
MVTEERLKELVKGLPKLVLADRCDRCPGQAYVRWMSDSEKLDRNQKLYLDFCAHHSNEFQPSLLGQGFFIIEEKEVK